MKGNRSYPFLFILPLCFIFLLTDCKQKTKNEISKPSQKKETLVLFLVSGFGSRLDNFSSEKIIEKIRTDTSFYILKKIRKELIPVLPSVKAKLADGPGDVPLSDTVLFLTDIDHLLPGFKILKVDDEDFFDDPLSYPFVSDKSGALSTRKKITLLDLTGVTAITRGVCSSVDIKGTDHYISELKPYFEKADLVHISNEVSIAEDCQCETGTMRFCSKEENFNMLLALHCNIVELTGNHNRDYGDKAFLKTLEWYKEHNIKTFGGGADPEEANTPLVIKLKDSTRLGFIGFNELCPMGECADVAGECGANRFDTLKAKKVIRKMKKELRCDYIIASVQFSEWDSYLPTPTQKMICNELLEMGADLVYGSQAHQVQQIAFINKKPVFYGLGNFIFDQLHKKGLRQAYFLQLYFYKGCLIRARPVFTYLENDMHRHVLSDTEAEEIKKEIYAGRLLY
jgi:poly-gamma-glutamate capsule biosynthesis protein CapA/YwtB (metallophosphatase superfamily)